MSLVVPFDEIFNDRDLLAKAPHWERVPFGTIANVLNGFPLESSSFRKDKGFPVIRIRDLKNNKTETYYSGTFPEEYIVSNGDLLIGMDGDFVCYEWSGGKAVLNQRVCKVVPNETYVHKRFILYCLNGYLKAINEVTSSVTVKHLSSRDIQKIPFPLPPKAEQDRIVAKLDALMEKIECSKARLEKVKHIEDQIFRRYIFENGSLYQSVRLERFCHEEVERIGADWPSCRLIGVSKDEGVVDLRSGGKKTFENYKIVRPGWFLYNPMRVDIGSIAIYDGNKIAITSPDYIVFSTNDSISPLLLLKFLKSEYGLAEINNNTQGAVRSRLYFRNLIKINFPYCGISKQQQAQKLLSAFKNFNLKQTFLSDCLDKLTQSLLSKAFSGQLVKQNPNDEPASTFIKRIEATATEKNVVEKVKRERKRKIVMEIYEILQKSNSPLTPKEVWQMSHYKNNIDAFYSALKKEVKELKRVKESKDKKYLELVK